MKTALIVRHVPYEGVAGFREPIEAAGYAIDRVDVTDPTFPDLDLCAHDLLVMMGGPMGVGDTDEHPWIAAEIAQLARRLETGAPTLGVCLGAQMIAAAMGGRVYRGPGPEIGFAPLNLLSDASPLRHLQGVSVLHWHGDTFDLPADVELLASTDAYPHQGFRRGRSILALQFHAEMGEDERFAAWLDYVHCPEESASLAEDYDRLGPVAVQAGRAMIAEWLAGLD